MPKRSKEEPRKEAEELTKSDTVRNAPYEGSRSKKLKQSFEAAVKTALKASSKKRKSRKQQLQGLLKDKQVQEINTNLEDNISRTVIQDYLDIVKGRNVVAQLNALDALEAEARENWKYADAIKGLKFECPNLLEETPSTLTTKKRQELKRQSKEEWTKILKELENETATLEKQLEQSQKSKDRLLQGIKKFTKEIDKVSQASSEWEKLEISLE